MYGYGPLPRPRDLAFSSSTASTISAQAFSFVEEYYAHLLHDVEAQPAADIYAREMNHIRAELLRLLGLKDNPDLAGVEAIMAASGTDIHLFAAAILSRQGGQPLITITLMGSETGSGVMTAAAGRHFMQRVSSGSNVVKGEEINPGDSTLNTSVAVRNKDGTLRSEEEVESEIKGVIELARAAGMRCLLVCADVSKTGLIAPSLESVFRLKAHFGAMLDILIDACQFRVSAATIRAYLAHEFLVAVTGSKFLTGPVFSGALLCPPGLVHSLSLRRLPPTLADYCTSVDWPEGWAAQDMLPHRANFGLLLRWKAALFELERFAAIPADRVRMIMSTFANAVRVRLEQDDAFEMLDSRPIDRSRLWYGADPANWDEIPSIFSFYLRNPHSDAFLTAAETAAVYKDLAIGTQLVPIRVGQPVLCADMRGQPTSALRICLSAPLIADASKDQEALENVISQAMAALDGAAYRALQLSPRPVQAQYA
jgi:DNA-binding phage protein